MKHIHFKDARGRLPHAPHIFARLPFYRKSRLHWFERAGLWTRDRDKGGIGEHCRTRRKIQHILESWVPCLGQATTTEDPREDRNGGTVQSSDSFERFDQTTGERKSLTRRNVSPVGNPTENGAGGSVCDGTTAAPETGVKPGGNRVEGPSNAVQPQGSTGVKVLKPSPKLVKLDSIPTDVNDAVQSLNSIRAILASGRYQEGEQVKVVQRPHRLELEIKERDLSHRVWQIFANALGVVGGEFTKSRMDVLVEELFGTIDKPALGRSSFGGREFDASDPDDAHLAFSLYLGRKCFPCAKSVDMEKSLVAALNRLTTPCTMGDREHSRAKMIMHALCQDLFTKDSLDTYKETHSQWRVPVHKTSCYEKGVKREVFYQDELFARGLIGSDDLVPFQSGVRIVPILAGGKIRVITVDSAANMRLSYLNGWMAHQVRQERWSIFGRTPAEWLKTRPDFAEWTHGYLSGDLEAATDNFDGRLTDVALKHIAEISGEDYELLRSFTTNAMLEYKLAAVPGVLSVQQLRGQLMGSFLSFPILCLVALISFLISEDLDIEYVLASEKARPNLRDGWLVGINGDDIVGCVKDRGQKWASRVPFVGGVPSRGKTLVNKDVFTVNSELWIREEGRWIVPYSVRPSLLLGICDGRKATPQWEWQQIARSPLLSESMQRFVDLRMKAGVPTALGGLGIFEGPYDHDAVQRACDAKYRAKQAKKVALVPAKLRRQIKRDARTSRLCKVRTEEIRAVRLEIDQPFKGYARWSDPPMPLQCPKISESKGRTLWGLYEKIARKDYVLMLVPERVRAKFELEVKEIRFYERHRRSEPVGPSKSTWEMGEALRKGLATRADKPVYLSEEPEEMGYEGGDSRPVKRLKKPLEFPTFVRPMFADGQPTAFYD